MRPTVTGSPTRPAAETRSAETLAEVLPRIDRAYAVLPPRADGARPVRPWSGPAGDEAPVAILPAAPLSQLGDPAFCAAHGLRLPYVGGAMAHGISSVELVVALGRAGLLGVFGAAGLPLARVEAALDALEAARGEGSFPFAMNLIHSPSEPSIEQGAVDLYLRRGVRLVEASAYLRLNLQVVRYRLKGLHRDAAGRVVAPNKIIAKVSRVEVAEGFLGPAPERLVNELLRRGDISAEEAELSRHVPVATDLTVEADSGGHTDNRPLVTLLPTMIALRDRLQAEHGFPEPVRIGAGGGIATPASAAAAFAMGAAYLVVGSVNQACRESGTSDLVRQLLAETRQADITMAPAADMFEMGVKVQVLKRGTLFAQRANKLYELYRKHESLDALPPKEREELERKVFRLPLTQVWEETRRFFAERDPSQLERAETDPKHQLALTFRWYLGQSSFWAKAGLEERRVDLQIWCGPAMGAFNEWTRGSFLEAAAARDVVTVAHNLLHGAALLARVHALAIQGVRLPAGAVDTSPKTLSQLEEQLS
ncbi:MAG: PfaD family polyunsaturated fatty acid/polyketide biosynthesis protein [Deltaproteobacteria bacterium]|nr:PfaD family polyunsaturated fatty acid/polyketide biosynthesis protein [Deltaproteobacteria bacterium]